MGILKKIKEKGSKVDPLMKKALKANTSKKNSKMLLYHINSGGKRFRPFLTITSCQLCGGTFKDAKWAAAAVELAHNYSLIVDDIIDDGKIRRGEESLWKKFGRVMAECSHLHYAGSILKCVYKSKKPIKTAFTIARTLKTLTEGEIKDILMEQGGRDSDYIKNRRINNGGEKDYFDMIKKKTAELIKTSCKVGGISTGASKDKIKALGNYGENLGIAFQIMDDYLDIMGAEESFGKKIGKDIKEQKLGNLLILLALKELGDQESEELFGILKKKDLTEEDIKKGVKLIKESKISEKSLRIAKKYSKKAKEYLNIFPENRYKEQLGRIADFVVNREI